MLAVFDKTVAEAPEGLKSPASGGDENAIHDVAALLQHFSMAKEEPVTISIGSAGTLAYYAKERNPFVFQFFGVLDNMFCLFEGRIDNLTEMRKYYGLSMIANDVVLIIQIYRTLRDRGPHPAEKAIREIEGRFSFVLFDITKKSIFIAADYKCSVPFFWGVDSEERLILSDDADILKKACGKSFAPFPKGCFYTSTKGLRSFEHSSNVLKAVPWVDSQGEVCGATYEVDFETKRPPTLRRVDSDFNWTSEF